jgi:hypothetical protein
MANLGGPNRLLNSAEVGELLGLPERTIGAEWKRWGGRPTASAGLSAGASVTVLTSRCPSHWLTSPSGCPRTSSADANACRRLNPQPASARPRCPRVRDYRSRELAQQAGDELGVIRACERPAAVLAARREWVLAERYIEQGLVFCRERGLESSLAWLTVLAAEAGLALGRWDDAASTAGTILAWPAEGFSHPRISALVILARVRARRGEPGYRPLLDEAASIAKTAPTVQAALLIGAARGGRVAGRGTGGADRCGDRSQLVAGARLRLRCGAGAGRLR